MPDSAAANKIPGSSLPFFPHRQTAAANAARNLPYKPGTLFRSLRPGPSVLQTFSSAGKPSVGINNSPVRRQHRQASRQSRFRALFLLVQIASSFSCIPSRRIQKANAPIAKKLINLPVRLDVNRIPNELPQPSRTKSLSLTVYRSQFL